MPTAGIQRFQFESTPVNFLQRQTQENQHFSREYNRTYSFYNVQIQSKVSEYIQKKENAFHLKGKINQPVEKNLLTELSGKDFNPDVIAIINEVKYSTLIINEEGGNLREEITL